MKKKNLLIVCILVAVIVLVLLLSLVLPKTRSISPDAPTLDSTASEISVITPTAEVYSAVPLTTETATVAAAEEPTEAPTEAAAEEATEAPTEAVTEEPTEAPDKAAKEASTEAQTEEPTTAPIPQAAVQMGGVAVDSAETATATDLATATDVTTVTDLATATDAATATDLATPTDVATATDVLSIRAYLLVTVNGMVYQPIPLTAEGTYTVRQKDSGAENVIHVTADSVDMQSSTCEGQDCVNQGIVSLDNRVERVLGNIIICLPNNVTLELLTPEEVAELMQEYGAAQ